MDPTTTVAVVGAERFPSTRSASSGPWSEERPKRIRYEATGAHYVVAPCANCKKQVDEVIKDHELPQVRTGLHDLMLKAIVLPNGQKADRADEDEEEPVGIREGRSPWNTGWNGRAALLSDSHLL